MWMKNLPVVGMFVISVLSDDGDKHPDERNKNIEVMLEKLKEKQSKNLFPNGFTTPIAVGIMLAFYTAYSLFTPKEQKKDSPKIVNEMAVSYCWHYL